MDEPTVTEKKGALREALEQAQRRLEELEVLNEIGRALGSTIELERLLDLIYRQTGRLMDTSNFFLALYDPERDQLHFALDVEAGERCPPETMPLGPGLTSYIIRTGEALLFPYGPDEFLREQGIERVGRPSKSWLGVPMRIQDRVIGVIAVQSYAQEEAYDEGHLRVLGTIAAQAAVAVENARLYEQARRRAEENEALYRIGALAASRLSVEDILQSIYEQASVVMDTSAFLVALYDRERDELTFELLYDKGERLEPFRRKRGPEAGLTGWILEYGESLLICDWAQAPPELQEIAIRIGEEVRSWLGVPMRAGEEVIGVIAAQSYEANAFDEHHRQVLETIAQQATAAIENARLYEQARSQVAALSALQQVGLKLAATTDLHEVLDAVAESARSLFWPDGVQIFLYDAVHDTFDLGTGLYAGGERGLRAPMPRKNGLTATVARSGEMVVIENVPEHPLYADLTDPGQSPLRSIAGIPLVRAGEVLGVLDISYYAPHRFSEGELNLLRTLADQAAVAVANARLFAQTQAVMQEMIETSEAQAHLLTLIQELSTPVIPLLEGVLVMPLVGSIDSQRGQQILGRLLETTEQRQSRVVLLDITGVPVVDTAVAQILLQTVQAVALLGSEAVLVGITPEVAQTLVGLGVDLTGITTRADLQGGLLYALRRLGYREAARLLTRRPVVQEKRAR